MLLAAVAVAEIWVPFDSVQGEGSSLLATVIGVFSCVMLAVRRVWPLASVLAAVIVWPIVFTITPLPVLFWGQFVPLVFAVYSVARHGRGRQSLYGAVAAAALLLFFDFRVAILADPSEVVFHWTVVSLAWFAGRGLRLSEDRAVASALLAAEVETRSREQTLVAIAEERTRIARELHDVVAHSVSVMVVQAGAAEQVVDDDPEFVRSALSTIRTTGAGALDEMRRVVAMLRHPDDAGILDPQPGMASLEDLIDETRAAGLSTELQVEGDLPDLPAGLDLAAYRIVQEALTNVRRHASAASARVVVRFSANALEVEVSDDGVGSSGSLPGHGIIGMRERAALYGGTVECSGGAGPGFRVRAVIPMAVRA